MVQGLNALEDVWISALWKACWQGGLALMMVWGVCRFVPRISPAFKMWLWRLAWMKLLLAFFWNSSIELPLLSSVAPVQEVESAKVVLVENNLPDAVGPLMIEPRLSLTSVLFIIWVTAVLGGAVRLGFEWKRSARLKRNSLPFANALFAELCSQLRIRRPPALRQSSGISAPVLVGVLRPVVIVPMKVKEEELRMMLAHELAHVKRRDLLWGWLPAICHVLFFFHPLLWLTRREWLLAQEMACDEMALRRAEASPAAYGNMLVDLVATTLPRPRFGTLGICETTQNLKRRIQGMKMIGTRKSWQITVVLLVVSVAGVLPWRLVAQDKPEDAAKRIEQLEKDNASLRQEMERLKQTPKGDQSLQLKLDLLNDRLLRDIAIASLNLASNKVKRAQKLTEAKVESQEVLDIMRAEFEKLQTEIVARNKSISEREAALAELGASQRAADDPRNVSGGELRTLENARLAQQAEQLQAEIAAAEADLKVLRERYTDSHPRVLEAKNRVQELKARQGTPKETPNSNRRAQERELYEEELKLAQKYADTVRKQMEVGRGTLEELVRAQRQVYGIQREVAKLEGDQVKLRQVLEKEMKAVQQLSKEVQRRIEIGRAAPGDDLDLQRELLKLRRELLQLE